MAIVRIYFFENVVSEKILLVNARIWMTGMLHDYDSKLKFVSHLFSPFSDYFWIFYLLSAKGSSFRVPWLTIILSNFFRRQYFSGYSAGQLRQDTSKYNSVGSFWQAEPSRTFFRKGELSRAFYFQNRTKSSFRFSKIELFLTIAECFCAQ